MTIKIPQSDKKYSQSNNGDFFGNIKQTKNISFTDEGYIKLEKRTRNLLDNATYTDLTTNSTDYILRIAQFSNKYWVAGTKSLYYTDSYLQTLTKDTTSGTPTLSSSIINDLCVFTSASSTDLWASYGSTAVKYLDSGLSAWTSVAVDVGTASVMAVFENLSCLAVAGANKVQIIDSTKTKSTLLTLPSRYLVKSMDWNNNRMYIGVLDLNNEDAGIFEWDGIGTEANYFHKAKGGLVSGVKRYKDGVICVTNLGQVLYVSGTIQELAAFPIYFSDKIWVSPVNYSIGYYQVLHGGVAVDKDKIYFAIDSTYSTQAGEKTSDFYQNNFISGVWCYDPKVGLHHRYSVGGSIRTETGAVTTANVNTTTDVITIPSAICPNTGTPVFYEDGSHGSGTPIAPLYTATKYYVINTSSTTLKLATTYANALAGTAIDLTGTGNNAQTLVFMPNDDFGGSYQPAKSLLLLKTNTNILLPGRYIGTRLLIGSLLAKSSTTQSNTGIHSPVFYQENRGSFVVSRVTSDGVTDTWQKILIKHKPLKTAEDKIIVKYRKYDSRNSYRKLYTPQTKSLSIVGTWVTSTTFSVDTATGADITQFSTGMEVEIINANGAGYLAHITDISAPLSTVYTITIDEAVQNVTASTTFNFTLDNWKRVPISITSSSVNNADGWADIGIGLKSVGIEVKIEVRGEDVEIEETQIISDSDKKAV